MHNSTYIKSCGADIYAPQVFIIYIAAIQFTTKLNINASLSASVCDVILSSAGVGRGPIDAFVLLDVKVRLEDTG